MFMKLLKDMSCLIVMKCKGTTGMNIKIIHIDLKLLFSDHI